MANNEVFANGLEVACKAADGMSAASFPDLCFTPGYPVPFANTAYAKDTRNGSRTVFITGKQVMLKDHSYFKTSTGNEPARGKKGFFTTVKKGKAYFRSWSMNVKIEGYNVCRHTDSMTHNHGSFPGNTGYWKYVDQASFDKCEKDMKRVERNCKTTEDKKNEKEFNRKNTGKSALIKALKKKILGENSWKKEQCKGLLKYKTPDSAEAGLEDLKKKLEEYKELAKNPQKAIEIAKNSLIFPEFNSIGDVLVMGGGKVLGLAGCFTSSGGTCADVLNATGAIYQYSKLDKAKLKTDIRKAINEAKNKLKETISELEKVKDLSWEEYADLMKVQAEKNKCLKSRKCMLVPFDEKKQSWKPEEKKNNGCCSGQTGHHIIPKSWNKCSEGKAPVVCTEGTTHSHGSHGTMHRALNKGLDTYARANNISYLSKNKSNDLYKVSNMSISKDTAVKLGAESHQKEYPKCDKRCIEAQLQHFYKKCDDDMNASTIGEGVPPDANTPDISETR